MEIMKEEQRQETINKIVRNFNDYQVHDSYWFKESEKQIEWSRHQEIYLILHKDKTWDYAEPRHLEMYVENLKDQDLLEYNEIYQ